MLSLVPGWTFGQSNKPLKQELDSMYALDQRNREWLTRMSNNQPFTDSLVAVYKTERTKIISVLWAEQTKIDSSNMSRAEVIIKQHGYPGKTLVGEPTNQAIFYIIQHSNKIPTYLPIVRKAAEQDELPFSQYAMMLDRALMYEGKPQLYGTQASCRQILNSKQTRCFVWPITDPETVNDRRKKAGFNLTVEENANRLNAAYEPDLSIDAVRKTYVFR
jgi:hypothetical protein